LPLPLKLLSNGNWRAINDFETGHIDIDKVDVEQLYQLIKKQNDLIVMHNDLKGVNKIKLIGTQN
jgi:hypothetical protein